ncbi:DUF6075 family protein [Sporosalibacterium faouarense]|uniref:DUF6075 family protein n=1 Tax=Sporosalibacterium faouarense TaxID=516123 RepID=UPI00192C93F8|nr:DUF6075 family protein [Sporosalibacterium faouarense]
MYFLNKDHAHNFQNVILHDKTHPGDTERMALFYILGGNEDLFMKCKHIYDFKNHEINPEVLTSVEIDLCSSSKALVRLSYNLFNGYEDEYTTPRDLFYNLDRKNFLIAKGGMEMRFGIYIEKQVAEKMDEKMEIEFL